MGIKESKGREVYKEGMVHSGKSIREVSKDVEFTASQTGKTGHRAHVVDCCDY